MSLFHTIELHAREKLGQSDQWSIVRIKCMPETGGRTLYYELAGAVYPPKRAGKEKGKPNYRKPIKGTFSVLNIPVDEHDKWADEWESRTNICQECMGKGKTVASCGVGGTTYRECKRCEGTGHPKEAK